MTSYPATSSPNAVYRRPLLLLLALASVVFLLVNIRPDTPFTTAEPSTFKNKFYMEDFTAQAFNESGQKDRIITGTRMNQPISTGNNHISEPDITLLENHQPSWNLSSSSAWLDNRHEHAKLTDNIVLKALDDNAIQLDTSAVEINLIERQLQTQNKVQILQPDGLTQGVGLEADLNRARFEIKSEVESTYEP